MAIDLAVLYRGPLESCNYACWYCPFAKHQESKAEHAHDAQALQRFVTWVEQQTDLKLGLFFTPWGEALIRRRYQHALAYLTTLAHVEKVAIQTNVSARLDWAETGDKSKLALWATFHPEQVSLDRFVQQCMQAIERKIALSVGVVGLKEHHAAIQALRQALPESVYVWINAFKRDARYYSTEDIARFSAIDPLFPINNQRHASLGRDCRAGQTAISVAGDGTMRRCHFIREPIGNIYTNNWRDALQQRTCTNQTCGCHIGYVHLDYLELDTVFGAGILERIPAQPIWLDQVSSKGL